MDGYPRTLIENGTYDSDIVSYQEHGQLVLEVNHEYIFRLDKKDVESV